MAKLCKKVKEIVFIRQNIDKWRQVETLAEAARTTAPDELADGYIDVTSDLSFAQTHYRDSRITQYLNALSSALHNELYRYKRERLSRILTFWTREVPDTVWQERRCLLASLLVFLVSMVIGAVSQWLDADFARIILGDQYVEMTLDNIAGGHPMAVYDSSPEGMMFVGIAHNNIMVSFLAFAMGVFTSVGPGYVLFQNGVMLGSFTTFFAQHDLLWESSLAIWLHGTLEISAIVIAGAAGIAMGSSLLFPVTYTRLHSFRMGARRGLRIVVGTVPVFLMAGFIEGFLTRHTEWPDLARLAIIIFSAAFIIFYFIYLPYQRNHGKKGILSLS